MKVKKQQNRLIKFITFCLLSLVVCTNNAQVKPLEQKKKSPSDTDSFIQLNARLDTIQIDYAERIDYLNKINKYIAKLDSL